MAKPPALFNISFHDLAPHTQSICQEFLRDLKALGIPRISLLVVPYWHRQDHLNNAPEFLNWLKDMEQEGHEICLHGFYHQADRIRGGLFSQMVGRVYTACEGEFYQLSYEQARDRLERGAAMLRSAGLTVNGFVAPAWLLSRESRRALCDIGFLYTTTLMHMDLLESDRRIFAPSLTFSCRSGLRRTLSQWWVRSWYRLQRNTSVLRMAIHPSDLLYPSVRDMILSLAEKASRHRTPGIYRDLARMKSTQYTRVQNEKRAEANP